MNQAFPNILYLHSHDTGRYLQPYGHAIPTPNLQALAEAGVLFRQAFCAAPSCSPSRAALLTGQCAHSSGMTGLANRGHALQHPERHIVGTLKKLGYHAVLTGIQHIAGVKVEDAGPVLGYDEILGESGPGWARGEGAETGAVEFLRRAREKGGPFFLDVGFFETHRYKGAFHADEPRGDGRYCLPPAPLSDTSETRRDMADYIVSARRLDQKIGLVLQALEETGLAENTLVIYTTDHGLAFPAMKCNLTDHGIGVALIMRGPNDGDFRGGQVVDALVSQIDVFPTLCDVLEIDHPAWLQGQSLLPLVRGGTEQIHEEIFAEINYHAIYEPQRAVRTQRWKYIRRGDERQTPAVQNCDSGLSKNLWLEHGWRERATAKEQLYDLVFDPNEANNLANDEAHAAVLEEMRERLERWMRETDDPLLHGPIALPPGAVTSPP